MIFLTKSEKYIGQQKSESVRKKKMTHLLRQNQIGNSKFQKDTILCYKLLQVGFLLTSPSHAKQAQLKILFIVICFHKYNIFDY
jgi:hypothetical protein